ncbi:MAG: hypothetical protein LQ351_004147 [Letrouitia transgressa]|nr:MAG: hypothetical protein LQ351_004147 [Letrouitia transgressa]
MSVNGLQLNGIDTVEPQAKKLKLANNRRSSREPQPGRIFTPFRTVGLVSPTSVPFASIPLGKTTFQITTSVGRCIHTYDLRRGLNLVFLSRPQTPGDITATFAWKDRVFAAWGGVEPGSERGLWVFKRGLKINELQTRHGLTEPILQLLIFGSWIIGYGSSTIEVWKSSTYQHYTTIHPYAPKYGGSGGTLSGGVCSMPTFLNKIFVGKADGSIDIWNVSTGKLVYTIYPPSSLSGSITSLQPSPALSLLAIGRSDGSLTIHDIRKDEPIILLNAQANNRTPITSISFRTDGIGAGEDGQKDGIVATASTEDGDVTLWDLNDGGRVAGILRGAHNPPSSQYSRVSGGISKVEFLPGQDVMITSGLDNALKSWIFDANSLSAVPRVLHSRGGHAAPVTKLYFMPTGSDESESVGKWILSAGRDQSLWGWSVRRDGQSTELSQGNVRKKAQKLGILGKDLEGDQKKSLEDLKAPEITCFSCSLNRDGGMGASAGGGAVWANVANKKGSDATASSATGWESIVTGHRGDKYARTWFWGRKKAGRWAFETADSTEVSSVAVTQCGTFALVGSHGGSISMFNLQSGIHRQRFPSTLTPAQAKKLQATRIQGKSLTNGANKFALGEGQHKKAVTGLMVDSLNRKLFSCSLDGKIKLWDFRTGSLDDEIDWSGIGAITAAQYYRHSDLIAFSCDDLAIRVIDTETKKVVRELWGCLGQINDFCFSNDGRWIVAAAMDSTIRVWDLPTGHLINALRLESPCTSLSFSDTGEYLATAHVDGVGVNLWNNRTLFAHVPSRLIHEDEVVDAALPTSSGEGGQGLLAAAFEEDADGEERVQYPDEDGLSPPDQNDVDSMSRDLQTLSLVPRARWQTLLHLDTIRERNKPVETPKPPEKAPFFLPPLPTPQDLSHHQIPKDTSSSTIDPFEPNQSDNLSRIITHRHFSSSSSARSRFTALLHAYQAGNDTDTNTPNGGDMEVDSDGYVHPSDVVETSDPTPLLAHLSSLSASTADVEIRALANVSEMRLFVRALTARLRQKRDYEMVQVWMRVFLRCHSGVVTERAAGSGVVGAGEEEDGDGRRWEDLREELREWKTEAEKEGQRLTEMVGYCKGVVGWLRSGR